MLLGIFSDNGGGQKTESRFSPDRSHCLPAIYGDPGAAWRQIVRQRVRNVSACQRCNSQSRNALGCSSEARPKICGGDTLHAAMLARTVKRPEEQVTSTGDTKTNLAVHPRSWPEQAPFPAPNWAPLLPQRKRRTKLSKNESTVSRPYSSPRSSVIPENRNYPYLFSVVKGAERIFLPQDRQIHIVTDHDRFSPAVWQDARIYQTTFQSGKSLPADANVGDRSRECLGGFTKGCTCRRSFFSPFGIISPTTHPDPKPRNPATTIVIYTQLILLVVRLK